MAHASSENGNAHNGDLGAYLDREVVPRLTVESVFTHESHQFKKATDKVRGGCPWHQSKSGTAFYVNLKTLQWFCPLCGIGGGPLQYRWRLAGNLTPSPRGQDFVNAARDLARLAGVPFPEREITEQEKKLAQRRQTRRAVPESVVGLCEQCLWEGKGAWVEPAARAREYLAARGFTEEELRDLRVGLYPQTIYLRNALRKQGHTPEDISLSCALFDMLTGYTTWPWNDGAGALLTIYGKLPYKPTPGVSKTMALPNAKDENGVVWEYTKRSPLYFDRAINAGQRDLVLVEGPTAAALPMLRGEPRMIACGGAQFSDLQVQTMKRRGVRSVTIALDPDQGGAGGVLSCIRRLIAAGIRPYVAPTFPDGLDPDEFILREGMDAWKAHIGQAVHG